MTAGRSFAALFLSAALVAGVGCGGGGSTGPEETEAAHEPAAPKPKSGEINLLLAIDNDSREEEENTRATVTFWRGQSKNEAPRFDATVESIGVLNGSSAEFSGGLTYTPRRAVLEYGGRSYELDVGELGEDGKSVAACESVLRQSAPHRLLQGAVSHRAEEAIGELNVVAAEQMLRGLTQGSGCGKQLQTIPFGLILARGVGAALDTYGIKSRVEVGVDEGGGFRHLLVRAFLHPKKTGGDEYDGLLELSLARVGEVETIPTPPPAPPIGALRKKLGAEKAMELKVGASGLAELVWAATSRSP